MVILIPASDYNKGENIMKHQSRFTYSLKVLFSRKLVVFAVCLVVLFVLIAVFIPVLSPYDPYITDMTSSLLKPSSEHWLGTDKLGRDVLTRLMYGTRTSLCIGVLSVFLSSILGVAIGLISGFYGGIVNTVLSRIVDALLAIPNIMFAMALSIMFSSGSILGLVLVLGISTVPTYARLLTAQVLQIKNSDFMTAEKVLGISNKKKIMSHLLPNCISPILVVLTANIGFTILAESSLNFLGLGVSAPVASWGGMVSEAYTLLLSRPVYAMAPGICIMLLVFGFNILGDGIRDAIDPRLRGTL